MAKPLQRLVGYLWTVISLIREQLTDSDTRKALLEELGLNGVAPPPAPVDPTKIEVIEAYLASDDPDTLAFFEVADSLAAVMDALETYLTPILAGNGSTLGVRDALYVWTQFASIDHMRHESPALYVGARVIGVLDDEIATHRLPNILIKEAFSDFPRGFGSLIESAWKPLKTEQDAAKRADLLYLAQVLISMAAHWGFPHRPDYVLGGWDVPGGVPLEGISLADSISGRAVTWAFGNQFETGTGLGLTSTWILIPEDHGGPGIFLSLGGNLTLEHPLPDTPDPVYRIKFKFEFPQAVSFFITGDGVAVHGDPEVNAEFEFLLGSAVSGSPAFALPDDKGSRLEIGTFGFKATMGQDDFSVELIFDRSALVLDASDPDHFLSSVFPSGGMRADFNLAIGYDFVEQRFFFGGSTKLEVVIPIGKSLGPLTIYHVSIGLGMPEGSDGELELALRLSLSLKLFAVTGLVDQIGYRMSVRATGSGGRLGLFDVPKFGFVPPRGIGLQISGGIVKGAGFVFFDPDNDEYAGALDLKIKERLSLKVMGLITTGLEEPPGFSLLVIGSVEGLNWEIFAGGKVTGIGVVFGMHRTMSVEAFQAGIKNHTLDAILFPSDPVGNAPQLLQTLKTVFPTAPDQWIVGVSIQASWIDPDMVKIEVGLLFEFPSPYRMALLGQVEISLPKKALGLVQVNFDVIGIFDFDETFLSIDSVLYDSRIGKFPMSGGLAVRWRWGDKPGGAAAIGGLHPRFPLPEGLPRLDRLAVALGKGKNPRIRGLAYLGFTSNTFQFGVRAEFYVSAGGFSLEGDFGIDVLFQFDPFRFLGELSFGASVKYRGHTLAGLRVKGAIEGPAPWKARGKVRIKFLFVKVTKRFNKTWGDSSLVPVEPVDVWQSLQKALSSPDNWIGQLPSAGCALASLRPAPPGNFVHIHPVGALEVMQRVVPLGVTMDKFQNAPIAGERRFDITGAKLNGIDVERRPLREYFAPGQHLNIEGDAAVSRPSFEKFQAGTRFGSSDVTLGLGVTTNFEYEEIVINERMNRPSFYGTYVIAGRAMLAAAEHGAMALTLQAAGGHYQGPRREVRRLDQSFAAATVDGLAAHALGGITLPEDASYTEAQQAVDRYLSARPAARGRVQVVRMHERDAI